MDDRVRRRLDAVHERLNRFRETNATAAKHTHYIGEALKFALRSMRRDPERHAEAIAAVERELDALGALHEMFEVQELRRERYLRPYEMRLYRRLNRAIVKARELPGCAEVLQLLHHTLED